MGAAAKRRKENKENEIVTEAARKMKKRNDPYECGFVRVQNILARIISYDVCFEGSVSDAAEEKFNSFSESNYFMNANGM